MIAFDVLGGLGKLLVYVRLECLLVNLLNKSGLRWEVIFLQFGWGNGCDIDLFAFYLNGCLGTLMGSSVSESCVGGWSQCRVVCF